MKVKSYEAARQLGVHPANLMLALAGIGLGAAFEEVWPVVDEDWLEALKSRYWQRFGEKRNPNAGVEESQTQQNDRLRVSKSATLVVEKLWRNHKWGAAHVSHEQVQKHTRLPVSELEPALRELIDKGIIICEGKGGPYSLNSSNKAEVEGIAQSARSAAA